MDENKLMMQFLSEQLGTDDPKKIQNYLKGLDESKQKALAQKYQQWKEAKKKKQATKAAHGAKLDYIKSLKHICPEGQELYYFKKGGLMKCGCKGKKMEDGAKVEKAESGAVAKFKKVKKGGFGITAYAQAMTGSNFSGAEEEKRKSKQQKSSESKNKEGWRGNDYIVRKSEIEKRRRQLESNKNEEGEADPNRNKKEVKKKTTSYDLRQQKITVGKSGAVARFKSAKCGSKMKKK